MTEPKTMTIPEKVLICEMQAQLGFLQGRTYQLGAALEGYQQELADANTRLLELQEENAALKHQLDGQSPDAEEAAGEPPEAEEA